jgi:hypothetical protein
MNYRDRFEIFNVRHPLIGGNDAKQCSTASSALSGTAMVEWSFPLELEREIFETTALRHPGAIPTLLRLCHRVHIW